MWRTVATGAAVVGAVGGWLVWHNHRRADRATFPPTAADECIRGGLAVINASDAEFELVKSVLNDDAAGRGDAPGRISLVRERSIQYPSGEAGADVETRLVELATRSAAALRKPALVAQCWVVLLSPGDDARNSRMSDLSANSPSAESLVSDGSNSNTPTASPFEVRCREPGGLAVDSTGWRSVERAVAMQPAPSELHVLVKAVAVIALPDGVKHRTYVTTVSGPIRPAVLAQMLKQHPRRVDSVSGVETRSGEPPNVAVRAMKAVGHWVAAQIRDVVTPGGASGGERGSESSLGESAAGRGTSVMICVDDLLDDTAPWTATVTDIATGLHDPRGKVPAATVLSLGSGASRGGQLWTRAVANSVRLVREDMVQRAFPPLKSTSFLTTMGV